MEKNEKQRDQHLNLEIDLEKWCENHNFSLIILLHPTKDELLVADISKGKVARYQYTPTLTFAEGIQTSELYDLAISPDGEWFAVSSPSTDSIDIRNIEDLRIMKQIQNEFTNSESMFAMTINHDASWLVIDTCQDPEGWDEKPGLAWIDLKTGETFAHTWKELNYPIPDGYEYGSIIQMLFSPDQSQLAMNEWKQGTAVVHLFPSRLGKYQHTSSLEEIQLSEYAWFDHHSFISDICFQPNSSSLILFKTVKQDEWKHDQSRYQSVQSGWIGELVAISTKQREELWRVTINSEITGSERGIPEGHFHGGYAGKVLVRETEVMCTAPDGQLLFFDLVTGKFLRKMKVNGNQIYAIGWHQDEDKIRVATDQELQVIEWK